AEDGIRDGHVTGVQTCALPIFLDNSLPGPVSDSEPGSRRQEWAPWSKMGHIHLDPANSAQLFFQFSPPKTLTIRTLYMTPEMDKVDEIESRKRGRTPRRDRQSGFQFKSSLLKRS